jgi:hypothetical protein
MDRRPVFWVMLGLVSFPGLFFPFNAFTFGYARLMSYGPVGSLIRIVWIVAIAAAVLVRLRRSLEDSYSWEALSTQAWPSYRDAFLVAALSSLMSPISAIIDFFVPRSRDFVSNSRDQDWIDRALSEIDTQLIVHWILQASFIVLTLAMIDRFFRFFAVWLAAGQKLMLDSARGSKRTTKEISEQRDALAPETQLMAQFLRNVESCNIRIYASVISMFILLAVALVSFIVVFQGSPTARALSIVSQVEQSPLLLTKQFFDQLDEVEQATDEIITKLTAPQYSGPGDTPEIIDLAKKSIEDAQGSVRRVREFAVKLASNSPNKEDSRDLIVGLAEIKREIESGSNTNWDLIVVRTAIVLLSFFALKVFFRVYEAAVNERRMWEERISAVNLIGTRDFKVGQYLALVGKIQEKDMSEFLDVEIDKIIEQIREMKKP